MLKTDKTTTVIISVLFLLYLYFGILSRHVFLADDLAKVFEGAHNQKNLFGFLSDFLSGTNMTSRPISGIVTGIFIYLAKYSTYLYYGLYIFFLASIFLVHKTYLQITKSVAASNIATLVYVLIPIGTSAVFSPIMVNSSFATIFFCIAVLCFYKKHRLSVVCSSFFFVLSFLSYEIFAPCIILFVFLKNGWKRKLTFLAATLLLILFYKKIVEPSIFKTYYKRESLVSITDFGRNMQVSVFIAKMFLRDLPFALYKSILNIKLYSWSDFIVLILFNISSFLIIRKTVFDIEKKDKIWKLILPAFLFSLFIFFFSTYKPTLFSFDNRNLGAVRFFGSLLSVIALLNVFSSFKLKQIWVKTTFSIAILILSISALSIKNSWIYANEFNENLFSELKQKLPSQLQSNRVFIKYNLDVSKEDHRFILREPIFYNRWESPFLMERSGLKNVNILLWDSSVKGNYYLFEQEKGTVKLIIEK